MQLHAWNSFSHRRQMARRSYLSRRASPARPGDPAPHAANWGLGWRDAPARPGAPAPHATAAAQRDQLFWHVWRRVSA
eukprot:2630851-Amphidinium_carterae.1